MSKLSSEIISQKSDSFNNLRNKRELWDKLEQLFHGQLNDSVSSGTKSQVFDPRLSSLLIERAYRVMAQLGIGKVKGMAGDDQGDAKLKNLLLEKYVVPNAKSQFDLLTKFRMVDLYSNLYGSFDVLVDQNIGANGYVGPDMWLLNKRDVFLPIGAISPSDAESIITRTWKSLSFFEGLKKSDGFTNIPKIIEELKAKKGSKSQRDSQNISKREEVDYDRQGPDGYYEILTRYEKDRWVDVIVDLDMEFRDIKNPHEVDELPIVRKYSIPLIDDPEGLGDGERGAPMQMIQNSLWNLNLDSTKLSMMPPVIINKDNVASMSSIRYIPGAKWLGRGNNIGNIAQALNLNPRGMETFNNTFQAANSSLLNVFGTSDTTVTVQQDSGYGKTPQALQMQQARENTRDSSDRYYMEQFVTEVMRKMVNLLGKKQSSNVSIRMFPDEIEKIKRDYPGIVDNYNEKKGLLSIPKGKKSTVYDYEIVSGSTYALDQKSQQENLAKLVELYQTSATPNGNQLEIDLKKSGFNFNFGELFKRIVSSSGIQDWDKILTEMTEEEKTSKTLDQDKMAFEQAMVQMGAMGQGGMGGLGAVPPTPQGMPPEMGGQPQMPQIGGQQ